MAIEKTIQNIRGAGPFSPFSGQYLRTRGVVVGHTHKGYYIQDPHGNRDNKISLGLFIFSPKAKPRVDALVETEGDVLDYQAEKQARPITQIAEKRHRVLNENAPAIEPVWLTAEIAAHSSQQLAAELNSLEGMLVGIEAGAVFAAPSNLFGDYVVIPESAAIRRTAHGGVLINPADPLHWLPGFRIIDTDNAPAVNVGATLNNAITGPLHYRSDSFQIAATGSPQITQAPVTTRATILKPAPGQVTILTLNGFNLDIQVERHDRVKDPRMDIDDDLGDGRFTQIAHAIVNQAASPDIIALQEIQDNDGAELSATVTANQVFEALIKAILSQGGPRYRWADIPPEAGADGGQPGGNIRNAFLYNSQRVTLVSGSLARFGTRHRAFTDSRKPLAGRFRLNDNGTELVVINVHLTSKRGQFSIFSPVTPGLDPKQEQRVEQAQFIASLLDELRSSNTNYYVTGDFNDYEFSDTLRTLTGSHNINLTKTVPEALRYDYNHRGLSQALMHGIVSKRQITEQPPEYEILHTNTLTGVSPGKQNDKPSDHAYVIARLTLR